MIWLWLLLIPYTSAAYAMHGGEIGQNVNRQLRNLICALPFGLVGHLFSDAACIIYFACSYVGTNMGFDKWPLELKGFVTFPPVGVVLLPFAYSIKTKWTNVFSEYFSGFLYGSVLALIAMVVSRV